MDDQRKLRIQHPQVMQQWIRSPYPPGAYLVSRARRFVWGWQINRLVTVAHIPGPLPECWQSQSDRFADSVTKQTLIIYIYLKQT